MHVVSPGHIGRKQGLSAKHVALHQAFPEGEYCSVVHDFRLSLDYHLFLEMSVPAIVIPLLAVDLCRTSDGVF